MKPSDVGHQTTSIRPSGQNPLGLQTEVLEALERVRQKHEQLQALLHQVMRKVALPRAREIGQELAHIKSLYPAGRKGPGGTASGFYDHAKAITRLSRSMVADYILIHEEWDALMDYMAELPPGAEPVTSVRSGIAAIRTIRKARQLEASKATAITVEAIALAGHGVPALQYSREVVTIRRKLLKPFEDLAATRVAITFQEEIEELLRQARDLLDRMEIQEQCMNLPDPSEEWGAGPGMELPAPAPAPAAAPEPIETESDRAKLPELFPYSQAGLEKLEQAIVEAGSGAALARQLGCSVSAVPLHRKRIRKALEEQAATTS